MKPRIPNTRPTSARSPLTVHRPSSVLLRLSQRLAFLCLSLFCAACTEREVRIHFEKAEAYRRQGKLDSAIAEYRAVLALRPNAEDARNNLGILYARKGQFDSATAEYRRAIEVRPDFAEAHYNLGVASAARGLPDSARAAYGLALRLNPDHAEAHNNLGALDAATGRYQDARAHYERALQLRPDFAEAHNNLGLLYAAQGLYREAIAHYARALETRPDFAEAHNNFGSACAELEQFDRAIHHFERALHLNPDYALARENLARAKALLEEVRKARAAGAMRAKHILVKTEMEARALLRKLEAGAAFEDLARRHSTDPSAKAGGDLGRFYPGDLLLEFERAVRKLAPGETAGPVRTPAGYHIIERIY